MTTYQKRIHIYFLLCHYAFTLTRYLSTLRPITIEIGGHQSPKYGHVQYAGHFAWPTNH